MNREETIKAIIAKDPASKEKDFSYCSIEQLTAELNSLMSGNITIGTWLPVFPGFYGTFFDGENMYSQELDYIRETVEPESLRIVMIENFFSSATSTKLWKEYTDLTARQCVKIIEGKLKELAFVESIKFDEICSPREYNFSSDTINIEVVFSAENVKNIRHFISEHFAQWKEYLKETYTSYDGFMSFHSNDSGAEEWYIDSALNDKHNAGSILEFLCGENEINSETLYYGCEDNVCISIDDYEAECIEKGWWQNGKGADQKTV